MYQLTKAGRKVQGAFNKAAKTVNGSFNKTTGTAQNKSGVAKSVDNSLATNMTTKMV